MNAVQDPALIELLVNCQINKINLNDWENERVVEWQSRIKNGFYLSPKVVSFIKRFNLDIKENKKPIKQEQIEQALLGLANPRYLHKTEVLFIEQMAGAKIDAIKLSPSQRAWLCKIEGRIHKSGC